jgi:hypothetical protein
MRATPWDVYTFFQRALVQKDSRRKKFSSLRGKRIRGVFGRKKKKEEKMCYNDLPKVGPLA